MTNIILTANENIILDVFNGLFDYDNAAEQIANNDVYTTLDELALIAETPKKSVATIVRNLVKKGVLTTPESAETGETTIHINDIGIQMAFDMHQKDEEPEAETEAEEPKAAWGEAEVEAIKTALSDALGAENATKCSALRAVAASCEHPRAAFIQAAEGAGINRGTAARQWQEGRAEGSAAETISQEDRAALAAYLAAQFAADELAAEWIGSMTKSRLNAFVKDMRAEC